MYAHICGAELLRKDINVYRHKKINFTWVTSGADRRMEKVEAIITALLTKVINQAQTEKLELLPRQRKILKQLLERLPITSHLA